MPNKIACVLVLLLLHVFAHAQFNKIDSLKNLLRVERTDTSRAKLLNILSFEYSYLKPDTALLLAQQGLTLARSSGFALGEIKCLINIGNLFFNAENYPRALEFDFQALKKAESINREDKTPPILMNIGNIYHAQGEYKHALDNYFESLIINKRLSRSLISNFLNIGDTYEKLNMLDSAKYYDSLCYSYAMKSNNKGTLSNVLNNLGNTYSKNNQDAVALNYYRSNLPNLKQEENDDGFCEAYLGMAKLFQKAGNTDSSLHYAKLSLSIAKTTNSNQWVMDVCNFLTSYFSSLHRFDSAFAYQSAAIIAKDSLFSGEKFRKIQGLAFEEHMHQEEIAETKEQAHTQLKINALIGGIATFLLVALLLYRNSRQQKKAKGKIEVAYNGLKSTQAQLIQSEKMASLGELTAGIAHEIQNPLNFVNNFSELNKEMIEEIILERNKPQGTRNEELENELLNDIKDNEEKINHHGKRADAIVKGMLQHSQSGKGIKEPTDINALCDEYLKLSYHGLRAKDKNFNADIKTEFDNSINKINIVPQDIARVLINLISNAFYAVNDKKKTLDENYQPTVSVQTKKINNNIEIKVSDNGNGIPSNIINKIFQPFFTTKPAGQGTGLGLSLSYDIIKAHGGEIKINTKENEFTEFVIYLPFYT